MCLVLNKFEYVTFEELYKHHNKVMLGYLPEEKADSNDMLIYYSKEDILKYCVVGIEIKKI